MYAWTLNINGKHIEGRLWSEFIKLLNKISNHYGLHEKRRIIIYVHNLAYEFQFFRCRFNWYQIFALKEREIVKAITDTGIEFRCSYILFGMSLKEVGEHLTIYKINKMIGDLDYSKIRNSKTPLTDAEWVGMCCRN